MKWYTKKTFKIEGGGGCSEVEVDIEYLYSPPYPERTTEPYEPAFTGCVDVLSVKVPGLNLQKIPVTRDLVTLSDGHYQAIAAEILAEKLGEGK